VIEPHQTVVVEDGWQAEVTAKDHLVLARMVPLARGHAIGTKADPVMLEVFNNLFMSIAEQMGVSLQNTAYSVNIGPWRGTPRRPRRCPRRAAESPGRCS
jgi:5-oxoprolinase (ATP-hydrolysing)